MAIKKAHHIELMFGIIPIRMERSTICQPFCAIGLVLTVALNKVRERALFLRKKKTKKKWN